MDNRAIADVERRLAEEIGNGKLPPLLPKGTENIASNSHLVLSNALKENDAPWYRLAVGRIFDSMVKGEPRWRLAVRLISRMPANTAPLKQALLDMDVETDDIPWIGVPQLQAASPRSLAMRAAPELLIGHSIKHAGSGGHGTITLFFTIPSSPSLYLLTSGHVATWFGRAKAGDTLQRAIERSSPGQSPTVAVLKLAAGGSPIPAFPRDHAVPAIGADYGIGELMKGVQHGYGRIVGNRRNNHIRSIGPVPLPGETIKLEVSKVGAGSGETSGYISAVAIRLPILDPDTGNFIMYEDQIEISPERGLFSEVGDSGSLVFTSDEMVGVAMVNSGTSRLREGNRRTKAVSFASPVEPILSALGAHAKL